MFSQFIGATGQYDLTTGDESFISCVEFTVYGFTGSMIPQAKQQIDGSSPFTPNYFNCAYVNANTGVAYAAGTAIIADGRYIADTTGACLSLNVTDAGDASAWVSGKPFMGPAPSFVAGSGSSSIALGTATAAAPVYAEGSSDALSLDLAGNLRTIDLTPAPSTPLPATIYDSTGTTAAAVKAASTAPVAADPAVVVAPSPNAITQVGGIDEAAALTAVNTGALGADAKAWTTKNMALTAASGMLFNGTTFDRQRGTLGLTALSSASRTTNAGPGNLTNYNHKGVVFFINVTVNAGTLGSITPTIYGVDQFGGLSYPLLVGTAITAVGLTALRVYPGITAQANIAVSEVLPRLFTIICVANNANPMTYSISYALVP